jgi:cytochrome oxidase Cu insertion factor (SCO1/SenC/PrrC family)
VTRLAALLLVATLFAPSSILAADYEGYGEQTAGQLQPGRRLPSFELTAMDGTKVVSPDPAGRKHLLLAFWSVYCEACVRKFNGLVRLDEKYSGDTLGIVSISTDTEYGLPASSVRDFLKGLEEREQFAIRFPVIFEGGGAFAGKLGISFLPTVLAVDPSGKVTGVYQGFSEGSPGEIVAGLEGVLPPAAKQPRSAP